MKPSSMGGPGARSSPRSGIATTKHDDSDARWPLRATRPRRFGSGVADSGGSAGGVDGYRVGGASGTGSKARRAEVDGPEGRHREGWGAGTGDSVMRRSFPRWGTAHAQGFEEPTDPRRYVGANPMNADSRALPATAVVTGAAGWLGQNLVRALAAQPERRRIRGLVRDPSEGVASGAGRSRASRSWSATCATRRDRRAVRRVSARASVFHAAAVIHPEKSVREFFDVNVGGTQLVLDRARRVGATRFVHVSSNSPFGANATAADEFDEDSPFAPYMGYGKSKLEAEQLVQRAQERGDLPTVVLRPPWFYGPFQPARQTRFFASIRRGTFPLMAPGTQRRSMVNTANLVQGALLAETADAAPGHAYWIADAEPYELATILADREGRARSGRRAGRRRAADRAYRARSAFSRKRSTRCCKARVGTCNRSTCSAS